MLLPIPLAGPLDLRTFFEVVNQLIRVTEFEATPGRVLPDEVALIVFIQVVVILALKNEPINLA